MELDQVARLKRYFFLGKLVPVYAPRKADGLLEDFDSVKQLLAGIDGDSFLALVKSQTQRDEIQLPRRNEVWFAYAVYLSTCERAEDRKKVYQAFPELAGSAEDMFTIVHYATLIQNKKGSKGLSRTVRKALTLWYKSKSESELVAMFEKNRGMYGLRHKDLIALSHINMEKVELSCLHGALFKPAAKALVENENLEPAKWKDPLCQERLKKILELKTCKDPARACELIRSDKLSAGSVPSGLLRKPEVWQALIPQMNYSELLSCIFPLTDLKVIGHRVLSGQLIKEIGNVSSLKAAHVSPVTMLIHAKKLQTKKRYSEKKKAMYYAEKVKRNNIKDNPLVGSKVMSMFKSSFDHLQPKLGLKLFIAINLQTSYATKSVINQTQVNCTEAAIALALTYFRSEAHVDVYKYTPMQTVLEKLNWAQGISYDDAQAICMSKQSPKNAQRLFVPLWDAMKKKEVYDVFLIIVPSAARGNPSCKPDKLIQNLIDYRTNMKNERTRFIVVNLRRYSPSMIHDQTKIHDNGILEICGFGDKTINIINAFATHLFS